LLAGITGHDYEIVLNTMSEDERQFKTWIFLDSDKIKIDWGSGEKDIKGTRSKVMKWV
jgi:hypothetical protein